MMDHEVQGGIDDNLSLADVTSSPDFNQVTNDIADNGSGGDREDGYGLVASQGTNPTLCNINITLFHNYIKS